MNRPVSYLNPPNAPPVAGMYSHVAIAEAGRLAFIAGQVAIDAKGEMVGANDLAAQVPVVFDNIGRIVKDLGAGFSDVVEFTSYIVGPDSREPWFKARSEVYARLFPGKAYPPNTLLIISGLVRPELLVEVSAIVRLP
jgi:enamine deaminase RidA (YjgF/YER057c/UK114 family)